MKIHAPLPFALFAASALVASADKTWTGTSSADWSDPANWAEGAAPANGENVLLTANTPFAPTNLDIEGLHINKLTFGIAQTQGYTMQGERFYVKQFAGTGTCGAAVTNTILNTVVLDRSPNVDVNFGDNKFTLHIAGTVEDEGRGYGIYSGGYGTLLLSGDNTYGGTTDFNLGFFRFFGDENLGIPTAEPRSMSLSGRFGEICLDRPPQKHFNATVIAPTRTLFKTLHIDGGCEVRYDGDLEEMLDRNSGFTLAASKKDRLAVFRYGGTPASLVNLFSVGSTDGNLLVQLDTDATFAGGIQAHQTTVDFMGHDNASKLSFYNGGPDYYPSYINSDRGHEVVLSGEIEPHYSNNGKFFGGPGDIRLTGDITEYAGDGVKGPRSFYKNDTGRLTIAGDSIAYSNATVYAGGTVVLDHTAHNTPKIPQTGTSFTINGSSVVLLGNDSEDSSESVGNIDLTRNSNRYDAGSLEVVSGASADATFTFGTIANNGSANNFPDTRTFDFGVRDPGSGTARIVATGLANEGSFGGIGPNYTWNRGQSWAMVGENGVLCGIPDFAFQSAFTNNVLVDAPAGTTDVSSDCNNLNGIRFRQPAGSTVNILNDKKLGFNNPRNGNGMLMTPESGDVLITGGRLDNRGYHVPITIHQYSAGHTLRIESRIIDTVNLKIYVTGPGTVTLANDNNSYTGNTYAMNGSTLEFTSVSPAAQGIASAVGTGANGRELHVGDRATLRYIGTADAGHATDRSVVLAGDATLDASGAGPLAFTREGVFLTAQWNGSHRVTLAGSGDASIDGDLRPGYFGSLRKVGTGTWTLSGTDSLFYYPSSIEEGTLRLAGNLPSDTVVGADGTLEALPGAALQRHVAVRGRLRYDYDADDPRPVEVWGTATLGGTLEISGKAAQPFTVLTAENGIVGTFDSVPDRFTIVYTDNAVVARPRAGTMIFLL